MTKTQTYRVTANGFRGYKVQATTDAEAKQKAKRYGKNVKVSKAQPDGTWVKV